MRPDVPLPTGTVTFLFTDIEGSTLMLRELGPAYATVLEQHHRILAEAVEAGGGVAVGTEGDALFAAFASAVPAVGAVAAAQRALAAHPWPAGVAVLVRMGLHTGEGTVSGGTYVGLDVHRAARIAAAAHGGQVLLSDATRVLAQPDLPGDLDLRDLGEHRLKDLARPEHLFQLVIDGLPCDFPPLRTLDSTPNNLPTQLTSFIGRSREVTEARRLLAGSRLLTLTGPGGTGKTRLGLQLAAEVAGDYPDGVFFVALGPVSEPGLVASTIVGAIGLQVSGSRTPEERLVEYVRDRRLLLVLDNFEQVLPAAPFVADLLRAGEGLRVVVTSRAALHLYGEQEFAVPPLGLPDPRHLPEISALSQYEAVALFIERAVAVKPDFEVTNASAPAVAEICARLDGLPLAIELAAARVKLLPPAAMLARLGTRLDLLSGGSRDLPARQQTLRGAIAWSHDLLDAPARRLFARFAVFAGGASLEAAEAVCGPDLGMDVLDGLGGLVDQSLLRQDESDGEPRFRVLGTIREFALECLAASGELDEVSARHAAVFVGIAEEAAGELTGSRQALWLDRLDRENDNLRAALTWAIARKAAETGLRLGAALWRFWQMRGLLREGSEWLHRLLALEHGEEHPLARMKALEAAGGVAYWRGDMDDAAALYEEALAVARRAGDRAAVANALYNAAFPHLVAARDVDRSRVLAEEALGLFRELGDQAAIGRTLWALVNVHYYEGDYEGARAFAVECVDMLRTVDDPFSLAWALHTLGLALNRLGRAEEAGPPWREAFEIFAGARDISGVGLVLGDLSALAAALGDPQRAARLAGASASLVARGGAELGSLIDQMEGRAGMRDAPEGDLRDAFAAGQAMTMDEAIAYARVGST